METKQELITLNGKEYLLDIEQAKQLGLLKEKDNRVKSWEEFQIKYSYPRLHQTEMQLYGQETTALAAFSKLLKLRRDWVGEWEPNWETFDERKYIIERRRNSQFEVLVCFTSSHALSFPTYELAQDFLKTFRDLIKEAKILI